MEDDSETCLHPQEAIRWNEFNEVTQCHQCGWIPEFQFQRDDPGFDLDTAVMQALGAASVCWDPTPTGVFHSERALEIGQVLIAEIMREMTD